MQKLEFWLLTFERYLKTNGFAEVSVSDYLRSVKCFFEYLKELQIGNVAEVDRRVIADYKEWLYGKSHRGTPLSAVTRGKRLICLKTFFRYLLRTEAVLCDPTSDLELPKVRDQLPRDILTKKEIGELLCAPDLHSLYGIRDRAILEVFYSTGIRVSELCGLVVEDADLRNEELKVKGKGGKERIVPLGEVVCDYLEFYLKESRPKLASRDEELLFVTKSGRKFHYTNVSHMVRDYGKKVGIKKRVTPHSLRHTCGTHLLKGRADIRQIQKILGHASIGTTQRYTRVEIGDLKKVLKRCHPRERREIEAEHV